VRALDLHHWSRTGPSDTLVTVNVVLFDLDDTLLDYSGGVDESWARAVHAGCTDGHVDPHALITALGRSRRWLWEDPTRHRQERLNMPRAWRRIVTHALESLGRVNDDLAETIAAHFLADRRQVMRLFPEARPTLQRLRERGIPLGLVTNGDATQQRFKIERHDLARYFDVMVIEGEFGAGKPDEAVYRHALHALDAEPADACMVGDNLEYDVEGARRIGIAAVWVDRARAGLPPGSTARPDHVIASLTDLFALP
jgi:putative hydrolase of the HAD superfamily